MIAVGEFPVFFDTRFMNFEVLSLNYILSITHSPYPMAAEVPFIEFSLDYVTKLQKIIYINKSFNDDRNTLCVQRDRDPGSSIFYDTHVSSVGSEVVV